MGYCKGTSKLKEGGSMPVHKIVVTGGPCGGKTTALSRIKIELSRLGYTVLVVPESATQLISRSSSSATAACSTTAPT